MIETNALTKEFDGRAAVDRLTIEVEAGEVFGFLGPNGAGKTTTVRMLTALLAPSSGYARVLGYRLGEDNQQIRRHVGILTESPGLYDRLSAWRNLMIYARLYEVESPERRVEEQLRWLGLWERRGDSAGTFSKGMRQKLVIARAVIHDPELIFLDEPTAGLDPEAAKLVRDFIAELRGRGRTIFLCTHNLDEADRLCDRVAVFKTQLRVVDSPEGLRKQLYGRQVVVHLAQPAADFLELANGLPFVRNVRPSENKLVLAVDNPESDNPQLIRRLVEAGAEIQFVGEVRHSLEEVYLQLVNE